MMHGTHNVKLIQKHTRLKMYHTSVSPALLHGSETWANGEQDKSRIRSAGMKFMRRKSKCTRQHYKINESILSELKINPVLKKIRNYRNKWIQHVRRIDRDRQTGCHT